MLFPLLISQQFIIISQRRLIDKKIHENFGKGQDILWSRSRSVRFSFLYQAWFLEKFENLLEINHLEAVWIERIGMFNWLKAY